MHACKSQQRMVQCGHVFLQGSIVRAALARLFCSALLAQLPFHPSHQARRCQMMLGAMRHHVQHLLQIGVHCDVHVVVLVGECVAGLGVSRSFAKFVSKFAMLSIFPLREISCEI
jgi:hypothetical protein